MRILASVLAASLALVTSAAHADEEKSTTTPTAKEMEQNNHDMLGKGSIIIGAERVWGVGAATTKIGDNTFHTTNVGFLWSNPNSVHQRARMGIDYIIFDNVTVGGALGIAYSKVTIPATALTPETSESQTNLLIAPRVGYLFGGRGVLSFWARLGPSFWNVSGDNGNWGLAINIEPAIIISPYQHLGIYLGGVLDLGIAGKTKGDNGAKYTETNYGINSGLVAWF